MLHTTLHNISLESKTEIVPFFCVLLENEE